MNTFATKPEVQKKALQKALLSTKIGKHGKRKETLLKEEVYKQVQAKILEKADKLIDAHIEHALTGYNGKPDPRVIELLLNRVFGKPAQELSVQQEVETFVSDPETRALAREALAGYRNSNKCFSCQKGNHK